MLDARIYQAGLVPALLAIVIAAFSLSEPDRGATTTLPPDAFDGARALRSLQDLSREFPDRRPDSTGDRAIAGRVAETMRLGGLQVSRSTKSGRTIDGERDLTTIVGTRAGRTNRRLVVLAHRDSAFTQSTAELSGIAALIELARVFRGRTLQRTIQLVSTSGGSGGSAAAAEWAKDPGGPVDAVLVLGDVAGRTLRPPLLVPWSNDRSVAPLRLRRTVEEAMRVELGRRPGETRGLAQVARLAFPMTPGEQGEILEQGLPAVLLQASGERGPGETNAIDGERLEDFGRTTLRTITALDTGDPMARPEAEVLVRRKVLPAWAVSLVVAGLILPILFVGVDGFARVRRRREPVAMWVAWVVSASLPFLLAGIFAIGLRVTGFLEASPPAPVPVGAIDIDWAATAATGLVFFLGWIGLRPLLLRMFGITGDKGSPGASAAVLLIMVLVAIALWALNPYSALLVLPALHLWLLIYAPGIRVRRPLAIGLVVLTALPALLLVVYYADHLGLGADEVVWHMLLLVAGGHIGALTLVVWSLGLGATACTLAVAWASRGGTFEEATPTTRGPATYAGPGSLGGTESALRP